MARNPRPPKRAIDLGILTGKTHYDVERAIDIIRGELEGGLDRLDLLYERVLSSPPALTLDQIREGLAAAGAFPSSTAGLLNTLPPPTTPTPPSGNPPGSIQADAYTAVCPDGTRVWVTALESGNPATVQFDDDAPISVPAHGMYPMAMSFGGNHRCVIKGSDGNAYQVDRGASWTLLGPVFGIYSVGIRTDGTPVWQDSATTYQVGGSSTPIPPEFHDTTNGFLALDGGGNPIWTDEQIDDPIEIDGVRFNLASRSGDWTAGVSLSGTAFLAYNHSTGDMYTVAGTNGSPVTARPMDIGSSAVVALSLPGRFVESDDFTPFSTESPGSIDLNAVVWLNTDVSGWAETAVLSLVEFTGSRVCLRYDKSSGPAAWPVDFEDAQGNPWIFAFIDGTWYASTYEWFTAGQECKLLADVIPNTRPPIRNITPVPGQNFGWMVSGRARDGNRTVLERSNVLIAPWPA